MMVSYSMGGNRLRRACRRRRWIGPLDPDDDGDSQLFSGPPALAIQDVLLEKRDEGLHRGVVVGGTDFSESNR